MNSSPARMPVPEGPGSASGAPNLPDGFTDTFASRYVDTGDLRQHLVTGGAGPPLLAIGGAEGIGDGAANTMRLAADDVRGVVIPGSGHYCLEEAPEDVLAALTEFLGPYRDGPPGPGPGAGAE
jgi:pimeloyl-ACP methyl ester carboxylesterase